MVDRPEATQEVEPIGFTPPIEEPEAPPEPTPEEPAEPIPEPVAEVVGTTSGRDRYIVKVDSIQKIMSKAEIEAAGGTLPKEIEQANIAHVIGVEQGREAREQYELSVAAERMGMPPEELAKIPTGNVKEQLQQFADKYGMSLTAAINTYQRWQRNPSAPEFADFNRWVIRDFERAESYASPVVASSIAWDRLNAASRVNPNIHITSYARGKQVEIINLEEAAKSGLSAETLKLIGQTQLPMLVKTSATDEGTLFPTGGWTITQRELDIICKRREEHPEIETARRAAKEKVLEFQRTHVELADGQWVLRADFDRLPSDIQEIGENKGYEAMVRAIQDRRQIAETEAQSFMRTNVQLADGQWISRKDADAIRSQSEYGYSILVNSGLQAYEQAIADALQTMEPYKRRKGYRIRPAVADGVPRTVLSLLFVPDVVERAWWVKAPPISAEEDEEEEVSVLPSKLAVALPAMGVVAVAEPTPFGEIILGGILAAVAVGAVLGRDVKWGAVIEEIKSAFVAEMGRPPTPRESTQLEIITVGSLKAVGITTPDIPRAIQAKAADIDVSIPPLRPPKVDVSIPPLTPPAIIIPREQLIPPTIDMPSEQLVPPRVDISIPPLVPPAVNIPQMMIASAQVATAEQDLESVWVVIRPVIVETGKYLPAKVPKTETALMRLDNAVQEAYARGHIDDKTRRAYHRARDNYLAKKRALNTAMRTVVGRTQPQLTNIDYRALAATTVALKDLQRSANDAATKAYQQQLTLGTTEAQAQQIATVAAQTALQTQMQTAINTAVRTATQTITHTATRTAVRQAVRTAIRAAVNTRIAPMTATALRVATLQLARPIATITAPLKIPIPPARLTSRSPTTQPVALGSIAWKQGWTWRYIEPKDFNTGKKPRSLPRGIMPMGADPSGGNSPYTTIQVVGQSRTINIPETISTDIGVVDVFISNRGRTIGFRGKGEQTNVGIRLPSTTQGMSIPAEDDTMDVDDALINENITGVSRSTMRKKKPLRKKKRLTEYEYMTTVKGLRL